MLTSGRLGRLNYLVSRFAADYREYGSWGIFRHEILHALLVEGGIHHFDQIRNLAGAHCATIFGHRAASHRAFVRALVDNILRAGAPATAGARPMASTPSAIQRTTSPGSRPTARTVP